MMRIELFNENELPAGGVVSGELILCPVTELRVQGSSVSLRWRTEGRGDKEQSEVASVDLGALGDLRPREERRFSFELPIPDEGPLSYDGKLVRILWEVRAHLDLPWAVDERETFPVRIVARRS